MSPSRVCTCTVAPAGTSISTLRAPGSRASDWPPYLVQHHHVNARRGLCRIFGFVDATELDLRGVERTNANLVLVPATHLQRAGSNTKRDDSLAIDRQRALNLFAWFGDLIFRRERRWNLPERR